MRITRERIKEIIKEELLQEACADAPAHRDEEELLPASAYMGEPTQKLLLRDPTGKPIGLFSGTDAATALTLDAFADTDYTLQEVGMDYTLDEPREEESS